MDVLPPDEFLLVRVRLLLPSFTTTTNTNIMILTTSGLGHLRHQLRRSAHLTLTYREL